MDLELILTIGMTLFDSSDIFFSTMAEEPSNATEGMVSFVFAAMPFISKTAMLGPIGT